MRIIIERRFDNNSGIKQQEGGTTNKKSKKKRKQRRRKPKIYEYDSSSTKEVSVQAGPSSILPIEPSHPNNTPRLALPQDINTEPPTSTNIQQSKLLKKPKSLNNKKVKRKLQEDTVKYNEIENLPGKKTKQLKTQEQPMEKNNINRCRVCSLFELKEDQQQFVVMNNCMGCGEEDCDYWVHVRCTSHMIKRKQDINKIKFFCPSHNKE